MNRLTRVTVLLALSLSALLFTPRAARAQFVEIGIHAGLDVAHAQSMSDVGVAARNGTVIGATLSLPLAQSLRFELGAQYVRKGIAFGVSSPNAGSAPASIGDICNTSYLELPVNIKFSVGSRFQVFVEGGTNIGTLLTAAREAGVSEGQEVPLPDISPVNIALEGGGGISYAMSSHVSVMADARYTYALIDQHGTSTRLLQASSWRPRELRLMSGLVFTL